MGTYDSLLVQCPNCVRLVEFQSKASDRLMRVFTADDCPAEILKDLLGKSAKCECGQVVALAVVAVARSE